MTITITDKDGLDQISKFSENKIKHITQTNQWGYVIETILRDSKTSKIMTAVEWLEEELNNIKSSSTKNGEIKFLENEFNGLLQQAKEMEKQQIIDAWIADDNELQRIAAEQYYNETFKNK